MGDLAKEIRVLVDKYVTSAGDQLLCKRWQRLRVAQGHEVGRGEQQSVLNVWPSVGFEQMSATGDMRRPQGDAGQVRTRQAGSKRQRRSVSRSKRRQNKSARVGHSCAVERQAPAGKWFIS
ncbi:hypothetical protein PPTG_23386 [Phytophthora nicotianae INRA-310]|uniref:Uncharacterized protein n=1 Tax=Phytophthora nicotianae (strain INRA-310) TaxID=761204 RepID=W2PYG2_PHYN3|nr:hypothetical protein PPTG_23386 [Phytophthora nicotianae INRA-310]ETN05927.1 hypothetical protein PPTG_23386 [Phytophthora nicotianae INRA-310]